MAADNIATLKRIVEEAWNKGNYDVLSECVSPQHRGHDPFWGDYEGAKGEEQQIRMLRTGFPDLRLSIDDIGMFGDKVYMRWTATGTHRGTMMGIAPTNRPGGVSGMTLVRFEGGRTVESWTSWDTYGFLANLGIVPALQQLGKEQPASAAAPTASR